MKRRLSWLTASVIMVSCCIQAMPLPTHGSPQAPVASGSVTGVGVIKEGMSAPQVTATGEVLAEAPPATGAMTAPFATRQLLAALDRLIEVADILTDPELINDPNADPTAIRTALLQAALGVVEARVRLGLARGVLSDDVQQMVGAAVQELNAALPIAALILLGPAEEVPIRYEELVIRGGSALTATNVALSLLGQGPSAPQSGHQLTADELQVPAGYQVEIMANGLNFLSAIAIGPDGAVYVAEAGFSYGNIRTPARVLRMAEDGSIEVVAEGFEGPLVGIAVHQNRLFVSHRGTISVVDLDGGQKTDIITGLPSLGDHFNENLAIGPDGKLYFTQGVATNTGVVGLDNYFFVFGWLPQHPEFTEIPCRDLTLSGVNYTTGNILTPNNPVDTARTGPYLPYGTPAEIGQVVAGQVPCTGAILRADLDGSNLEAYADGLRNPYGLAFHPDGRLFATEHGPDERGSRPVRGPDNFYEIRQGDWYGFPDYFGGVRADNPSRIPHSGNVPEILLRDPPDLADKPVAQLAEHSASNGFDFSRTEVFGPVGNAFIAQFGDLTPPTAGGVVKPAGQQVVMVTPEAGEVMPFLTAVTGPEGRSYLRPTDAKFSADGTALYVVHFGQVMAVPGSIAPVPGTGALLRITRSGG